MNLLLRDTCKRASTLAAALTFFLITTSLWAQGITISGVVTDPQNAAVPAATVILRGPGGEKRAKTNDQGKYSITVAQPGSYTLTLTFPGFGKFEASNIQLNANLDFDIPLVVAMEKQEVDVQDTDQTKVSTDPSQNGSALVLKGADLDMLSDDPDQLADDLSALAGPSAGPNGGQIFIDGFSGGQLPPKSSIREIRVNQNPYSAEFDRLGFGRIEILTKPGTDRLHGQIMFMDSDSVFNARNPISKSVDKPDFSSRFLTGSIGGPLSKKSSFNLDMERRWVDENAIISATILDTNLIPTGFNQTIVTPQTRWHITPRIDYALGANHTLVGRYSFVQNSNENQGVGTFNLPSRAYNSGTTDHTLQLTETSILGTHAVNETRFQFDHNHTNQDASGTLPTINVAQAFVSGSPNIGLSFDTLKHIEVSNMTTLTHGAHVFKFGARARHYSVEDNSLSNYNGTFSFNGGPAPVLDANNQPLVPDAVCLDVTTPGCAAITSLEQYRRTLYFQQLGYTPAQIRNLGGGATQFSLTGGNPLASVGQFDIGIYALDDWRIRPNFTLSYGLRYEAQTNSGDLGDFSPRLSIAWGIGGSAKKPAKTVLRAGVGVFYDRLSQTMTLTALRNNGVNQLQYIVKQPDFYPNVPSIGSLTGFTTAASRTEISNSIQSPYIAQGNIGIDRQLPKNITVAVNYIYSASAHSLRTRNINAPIQPSGIQPYGAAAGNIFLYESSGAARQNQVVANINARLNRRIQLFGFYVVQNAHSNTDSLGTSPAYVYDESTEWARSSFAPRQRMFIGGSLNTWKGISLSPNIQAQSGLPFNIVTGSDLNGDTLFADRPSFATNLSAPGVVVTKYGAFNTNPGPNDAIIPRNYGTGPGLFVINMRLSRTWGFGERSSSSGPSDMGPMGGGPPPGGGGRGGGGGMMMGGGGGRGGGRGGGASTGKRYNLTLGVNARNLLNHVNYGIPNNSLSSPAFGTFTSITTGGFGGGPGGGRGDGGGGAANNRRLDLSLRFTF